MQHGDELYGKGGRARSGGVVVTRVSQLDARLHAPPLFAQLDRPLRRRAHGVDERAAHAALLQLMHTLDRRAARAANHVLQLAGMLPGLEHHPRRAEHRLRGQLGCDVPRQAGRHAAIAQRLDDRVAVRWAAAAQAGHGVDQRLLDLVRHANGREQPLDQRAVVRRGRLAKRVATGALADQRRRVGHHAHHPRLATARLGKLGQAHAGEDGNHKMGFVELIAHRLGRLFKLMRLERQHDDLGLGQDIRVRAGRLAAKRLAKGVAPGRDQITGNQFVR